MKKADLRVVSNDKPRKNSAPRRGLTDIRKTADGSLEYRNDIGDGGVNWYPLCSSISVIALTRDSDGRNWGRLLKVRDPDGRDHQWAMPAALLASARGDECRQTLLSLGAQLAPGGIAANALHRLLSSTVDFNGNDVPRAKAAIRLGWHDDVFVLPGRALGATEHYVYQSTSEIRAAIRERGELEDWQRTIATPAIGNSRIVLTISAAFASTLLGPCQLHGCGIHFRGDSSTGKTTALAVAGSVWGGPRDGGGLNGFVQSWQATANGIEGMAEAHCDLPLLLDELSLVRGEDAWRVAYQLASGIGRTRATKSGATASRLEWRVFLISSGEISLADKVAESKSPLRQMAGQAVRFIDIPADAGAGFGLFERPPESGANCQALSAKDRGAAFSRKFVEAANSYFGTAGPAFVEAFITKREASLEYIRKTVEAFVERRAAGADGQVQRVARTFGLLAAAGELATSLGIVTWPAGESIGAAETCFEAWLETRGTTGSTETEDAIAHIRRTIEQHAARFQSTSQSIAVRDRIGFVRGDDSNDPEYLIQGESWKTLMAGRDARGIARALADRGILKKDSEGRINPKERIPGCKTPQRVYVVIHAALFRDGGKND
jgi:putative DNA primase/helicase